MSREENLYFMTGADRFQYFLDKSGRKKTGIGNVVKAHICLEGILSVAFLKDKIIHNKALKFLAGISPSNKWYSSKISWCENKIEDLNHIINFHQAEDAGELIPLLLRQDCPFENGLPIHVDVIFEGSHRTHLLFLVNHSLLDYGGMELLLKSISADEENPVLQKSSIVQDSFFKKLAGTIGATFFVAARSGWDIQRLKKSEMNSSSSYKMILVPDSEWTKDSQRISLKGLPLYIACTVSALSSWKNLFSNAQLPYFIPTPIDRRGPDFKNVLLSNYMSFLFFRINEKDITNTNNLRKLLMGQMIHQARRKMPDKFMSLMNLFSFLPESIYKAFLNLPSKGQASTFAFSVLPQSFLEYGTFMGQKVNEYTHFPPFISPPGLNIVFMEMAEGIKIVAGYDESMITADDVALLLGDIKNKLICA